MMSDLDPFAGLAKVLSALPGLPETVQLAALGTVCFLALVIAVGLSLAEEAERIKKASSRSLATGTVLYFCYS
jgi:hypothetical protein